jgi:hypothetical protein
MYKYFRALVSKDKRRLYVDFTSYTSKRKLMEDLRKEGYKVSDIKEITDERYMRQEAFVHGSLVLKG